MNNMDRSIDNCRPTGIQNTFYLTYHELEISAIYLFYKPADKKQTKNTFLLHWDNKTIAVIKTNFSMKHLPLMLHLP